MTHTLYTRDREKLRDRIWSKGKGDTGKKKE